MIGDRAELLAVVSRTEEAVALLVGEESAAAYLAHGDARALRREEQIIRPEPLARFEEDFPVLAAAGFLRLASHQPPGPTVRADEDAIAMEKTRRRPPDFCRAWPEPAERAAEPAAHESTLPTTAPTAAPNDHASHRGQRRSRVV